jgi:hypothetical protein
MFYTDAIVIGTHDRAVDHRVFVVGTGCQMHKDTLPDPGFRPTAKAPVRVFPIAVAFR